MARQAIRRNIHFGSGEEGKRRLEALERIAADLDVDAQHGPGISRMIQMIADEELEVIRRRDMKLRLWIQDLETGEVLEELGTCVTDSVRRTLDLYSDELDKYGGSETEPPSALAELMYDFVEGGEQPGWPG